MNPSRELTRTTREPIRDARRYGSGSIYVVEWPAAEFYKLGFAVDDRRWRSYESRGGRLLLTRHASVVEPDMHRTLIAAGAALAFAAKRDAAPYLGHGGAGWTECYRGDGRAVARMLTEVPTHA